MEDKLVKRCVSGRQKWNSETTPKQPAEEDEDGCIKLATNNILFQSPRALPANEISLLWLLQNMHNWALNAHSEQGRD